MTIPLVGLAGAARSGKDAAAHPLLDMGWTRRAFADKVRDMLYALNPVLDEPEYADDFTTLRYEVDSYGWETVKELYPEVRSYLQRLGTEGGRELLGEDVWVDALFRDFETWGPTVITDVRFPNEADAIRARGGLVLKVVRPGQKLITESSHYSERALDGYGFDEVILNDGPLRELYESVLRATQVRV
ncbi:hypothetical protein ACPCAA_17905 [Streptomyces griseoincarnatus]